MSESVIKACIDRFRSDEPTSPHSRKPFICQDAFWWLESNHRTDAKSNVISNKFKNRIKRNLHQSDSNISPIQGTFLPDQVGDHQQNEVYGYDSNEINSESDNDFSLLNIAPLGATSNLFQVRSSNINVGNSGCIDECNVSESNIDSSSKGGNNSESGSDGNDDDELSSDYYRNLLRQLKNNSSSSKHISFKYSHIPNISALPSYLQSSSSIITKLKNKQLGIDKLGIRPRIRAPRALKHVRVKLPTPAPALTQVTSSTLSLPVNQSSSESIAESSSELTVPILQAPPSNQDMTRPTTTTDTHATEADHTSILPSTLIQQKGVHTESNFLYLSGSDSDSDDKCDDNKLLKRPSVRNQSLLQKENMKSQMVDQDTVELYLYDPMVAQLWEQLGLVRECIQQLRQNSKNK